MFSILFKAPQFYLKLFLANTIVSGLQHRTFSRSETTIDSLQKLELFYQ